MTEKDLDLLKEREPDKYNEKRKRAKLFNFGGLYGGAPDTLASHVNEKLEEGEEWVREEDAQNHLRYFFGKYSGLKQYYDKVMRVAL